MARSKFGGALLLLLLVLSLAASYAVRRSHTPMSEGLEQAAQSLLAGDWDRADSLVTGVRSRWETWWPWGAALSDHTPMEYIDSQFSRLEVFFSAKEPIAAAALCRDLARQMEALGDAHALNLRNLL